MAVRYVIDDDHRLRSERLRPRDRRPGIEVWAIAKAMMFIERSKQLGKRVFNLRRRSWYEDAPVLRNWVYSRTGTDIFDGNGLINGSDIGSDDILASSAGGMQMDIEGDATPLLDEDKIVKR